MFFHDRMQRTSTAEVESDGDMLEAAQRLINALDHSKKHTTVTEYEYSGKYENLDIYVTTQIVETWCCEIKYNEQIRRIEIKVYKKDKLLAEKTINCLLNSAVPFDILEE